VTEAPAPEAPSTPAGFRAARAALVDDRTVVGRALCGRLTGLTDAWLARLYEEATGGDRPGTALVAVGGHGRGELSPGSDLDLLLLHPPGQDPAALAERLWYPVWDAGLKLGHAVRTVRQALDLASGDLDTATALLDVRRIAGDPAPAAELAEKADAQWRKRWKRWVEELDRRVAERQARTGEVAFLLEPDLKEGRGGLRDVHALRWAERARPLLLDGDAAVLDEAYGVLLDVRVELHRIGGRPPDQLFLERQDDVAAVLAGGDADALMAQVAAAARSVSWIADEAWSRARSTVEGPASRLFRRDRVLAPGVVLRDDVVLVETAADPAADPALVLRVAAAAAGAGARIDRAGLDRLAAGTPAYDRWPAGAREALVELLGHGDAAVPVLETLDQRRLLERLLPEWATVRWRPQRNAYHTFTVDRHLHEAAAHAAALVSRVARPDLLLVGSWLHDIGKGSPEAGDHSEVGAVMVRDIATRMGFAPDDVEVLATVARHHLLLPDVATRRDLSDEAVIAGVAAQVGSIEVLDLLAAVTEADSLATGPAAWGPWKAELLAELADRTARVLRGGRSSEVGEAFPPPELAERMAAGRTEVEGAGRRLVVVAPDRLGVVSRVAGALALHGVAVLAADVAAGTTTEAGAGVPAGAGAGISAGAGAGMVAAVFRVEAGVRGEIDWPALTDQVRRAIDGRLALEARLAQRVRPGQRRTTRLAPRVRVDNHASGVATIVEVHAPDGVGVLYRITRAFEELRLDVRRARIQTLADEVFDAFYVVGPDGGKVLDDDHVSELERAVLHQLGMT
jgi:[protein-PII] uridylyltransferase